MRLPNHMREPRAEATLAFPIGDTQFVDAFLETRKQATEELINRIVRMATVASASTPAVQSLCCLLRSCISQKVGHLLRITPPSQVSNLATHLDQCIVNATCTLIGVEDTPQLQKELLTIPASNGGWSLPALALLKECAYIGGAAATPRIQSGDPK